MIEAYLDSASHRNSHISQKAEMQFRPQFKVCATLGSSLNFIDTDTIKNETMFFNCGYRYTKDNAQSITNKFLNCLVDLITPEEISSLIIDSRVHMLKPGWYPCIPEWHCDDFHRPTGGQPDLETMPKNMKHFMMIVGDCSQTQFVNKPVKLKLPNPDSPETLYSSFTKQLNSMKNLETYSAKSGEIIEFTGLDLHRGMPAHKDGWRFFIRATVNSNRKPTNEIRRQTQVYLPDVEAGW